MKCCSYLHHYARPRADCEASRVVQLLVKMRALIDEQRHLNFLPRLLTACSDPASHLEYLGRLCAHLLTQHPDKGGAPWDGRKKGGETAPLGLSLTEVCRRECYFEWEEGMSPGLCRMCYHFTGFEDLPPRQLIPLLYYLCCSLFRNKSFSYLTLPWCLCF